MSTDDIVKLVLVFSVAFSIVGISIQIIRIFNSFIQATRIVNAAFENIQELLSKVTGDYDAISSQIKMILDVLTKFTGTVVNPLNRVFSIFDKFSGGFNNKDWGKRSRKKDKDEEEMDADYEDED